MSIVMSCSSDRSIRSLRMARRSDSPSGARPHRQCVARDGAAGPEKNAIKPWRRVGWVIPPTGQRGLRGGDREGSRCLPASLRCSLCGGVHGRDAPATDRRDARTGSGAAGSPGARRLRVPTLRNSCNVFMATEPLAGRRMTKVTARRTKTDWAHFLNDIARAPPRRQEEHAGDGQPEHPPPRRPLRGLCTDRGQGPVGPLSSSSTRPSMAVGSTSPRPSSTS